MLITTPLNIPATKFPRGAATHDPEAKPSAAELLAPAALAGAALVGARLLNLVAHAIG